MYVHLQMHMHMHVYVYIYMDICYGCVYINIYI